MLRDVPAVLLIFLHQIDFVQNLYSSTTYKYYMKNEIKT